MVPTLTCLSSLLAPHFDRRLLRPVFGMPRRRACCLWDAFECRLWMPPRCASFACCAQSRAALGMMPHSRATLHAVLSCVLCSLEGCLLDASLTARLTQRRRWNALMGVLCMLCSLYYYSKGGRAQHPGQRKALLQQVSHFAPILRSVHGTVRTALV